MMQVQQIVKKIRQGLSMLAVCFCILILSHPSYQQRILSDIKNLNIGINTTTRQTIRELRWFVDNYSAIQEFSDQLGTGLMVLAPGEGISMRRELLPESRALQLKSDASLSGLSLQYGFSPLGAKNFYSHHWFPASFSFPGEHPCWEIRFGNLIEPNECFIFVINPLRGADEEVFLSLWNQSDKTIEFFVEEKDL